jgi:hypothetical protein
MLSVMTQTRRYIYSRCFLIHNTATRKHCLMASSPVCRVIRNLFSACFNQDSCDMLGYFRFFYNSPFVPEPGNSGNIVAWLGIKLPRNKGSVPNRAKKLTSSLQQQD